MLLENLLILFFAVLFAAAVAVPLFLWIVWWESYLSVMDNGLGTAEIFHKAGGRYNG